jgi:hypothetical protein
MSCLMVIYLAAKPTDVGADVDGLAWSLHCPMMCNSHSGGLYCLTSIVLSHRSAVGGCPFLGVRSPVLDI